MADVDERTANTLVVRKPCFGLPTACPQCLSAYFYLKLAEYPFELDFHLNYPDSDQIPYFELGDDYVAYNNEKGGLVERLKKDIVNLDTEVSSLTDWVPTKVMLSTWLADALEYELWVAWDSTSAYNIYYSDLPWPLGKILYMKQAQLVKLKHGISKDNHELKEEEIYSKANSAYGALSALLGEQNYLFVKPSSLDAIFLAHAAVVLQALPESSVLRIKLSEHANLVRYVQNHKTGLITANASSSSVPHFQAGASSSSAPRGPSSRSSKPKSKPKREKTKEEKTFRRRAKLFLTAQLVAVVLFLTFMTEFGATEVDADDYEGYDYED